MSWQQCIKQFWGQIVNIIMCETDMVQHQVVKTQCILDDCNTDGWNYIRALVSFRLKGFSLYTSVYVASQMDVVAPLALRTVASTMWALGSQQFKFVDGCYVAEVAQRVYSSLGQCSVFAIEWVARWRLDFSHDTNTLWTLAPTGLCSCLSSMLNIW